MGKTLVGTQHDKVPVQVLDLEQQPRLISKGTLLAPCEPVLSIQSRSLQTHLEKDSHELPVCVKSLYDRTTEGLNLGQKSSCMFFCKTSLICFLKEQMTWVQQILLHITINTGEAQPLRQTPRSVTMAMQEVAKKVVQDMLSNGQIEPSNSPWVSPVMLVKKKDGSTRFCVDYHHLNAITRKDSYPLPRIDDTVEALAGMHWFSTLDLRSGYWQVKMDESSKEKNAFTTGNGLWQFQVMPFGLWLQLPLRD